MMMRQSMRSLQKRKTGNIFVLVYYLRQVYKFYAMRKEIVPFSYITAMDYIVTV